MVRNSQRLGYTRRTARRHLLVLLLYSLVTVMMTWPLSTQLGAAIPGDGFDGWQNVWNLWWMRKAWLVQNQSAYFTDMLHFPTGADLRFQTMAPFNGLTFLNVQLAVGLLPAYNAAVLFSFVIGSYGTYLLALFVLRWSQTRDNHRFGRFVLHASAFLAGLVYAFSPYHFAHLLGHLQLIVLQWIPFYVLYLLRGLERAERVPDGIRTEGSQGRAVATKPPPAAWSTRSWAGDVFKAGLFLMLVGLCDWYYVMYCLIFTGLVLLVKLLQRRLSFHMLGFVAATGLFFTVVLSPLLIPMMVAARSWTGTSLLRDYQETVNLSADVLAFVTPQVFHPIWGDWAAARSTAFTATRSEFTVFVGYTVLSLVGIALLTMRKPCLTQAQRRRGNVGLWLVEAGLFALLALGPVLHVNGRTALLPGGAQIPLPYALLYETVPFIKLSRSVSRMSVMVMLCLGVAAAFGSMALARWLAGRRAFQRAPGLAAAVPAIAAALILFEFLPVPFPVSPPDTPSWYQTLAVDPINGAILNLPATWERPGFLLYQTTHDKPMATGYITRDDPQTLIERAPVLVDYHWLGPDIHTVSFDLPAHGMQVLNDLLGIHWVVLDRYKMPGQKERQITEAITHQIFASYGLGPSYEDDRIAVYEVVEPAQRSAYLILEPGWSPRQVSDDGRVHRLLPNGSTAGVEVINPGDSPLIITATAAAPAGGLLGLQVDGNESLAPQATDGTIQQMSWTHYPQVSGPSKLRLHYDGGPDTNATIYALAVEQVDNLP